MARFASRQTVSAALALFALGLVALHAQGGIVWTSDSTLTTQSVEPRTYFVKGENADDKRWFKNFDLSTNQTSFDATVKPNAGGHSYIQDVVLPTSRDDESRTITLTGSNEDNTNIEQFRWYVYDGTTKKATLDHQDANPSASFTLPAGDQYRMDLEVDLKQGAGQSNAGIDFTVQLEVT